MAELYQLIGTVLRDIAHARHVSDVFSRQLSHSYERDSLLRRFPVPRAEISEVEFELKFWLKNITVDSKRTDMRDAKVTSIFEQYSAKIVDDSLDAVKLHADSLLSNSPTPELKSAVQRFEVRYFSKAYRDQLHSSLFRYFERNQAALIDADGELQEKPILDRLRKFAEDLARESDEIRAVLSASHSDPKKIMEAILTSARANVEAMRPAIKAAYTDMQDFAVDVNVDAQESHAACPVSSVKVKAVVRNYRWEKVDVDTKEMQSVRTLAPE
jgi:hypothetical protein